MTPNPKPRTRAIARLESSSVQVEFVSMYRCMFSMPRPAKTDPFFPAPDELGD